MKTTATLTCALAIGTMLTASAFANTVKMYNTSNDGVPDAQGGEFWAVTDAHGSFYTFCLERYVHIGFTETYTYDINSRAFGANVDHHDPVGAGAAGDPISRGTAYLYEQFVKGALMDSDGSGSYWDRHDLNAGLLQKAFWTLEDEYDFGPNPYVSLVKSLFGNQGAFASYTGSAVRVMNLWGKNRKDIQSQLIYVPDAGATTLLLIAGLVCIAAFRHRVRTRSDRIARLAHMRHLT
jgi:hypothetical protein